MKEAKYLLLVVFFFFNISFASCRNQKVTAVAQSDSVEENESKNSNLLEIIRSHKYLWWCKDDDRCLLFDNGYSAFSIQ